MHYVRESESQIVSRLVKDVSSGAVALLQGFDKVFGLAAFGLADQPGKDALGFSISQFTDFCIHRPTGAARFHCCAVAIQTDVPDFRFSGSCAVVNASLEH